MDSGPLTIGGLVTASAIGLTGAAIAIPRHRQRRWRGQRQLWHDLRLDRRGRNLIAGLLTGGSTGSAILTGATPVTGRLGPRKRFAATGFTLNDGTGLTVAGNLAGGPGATIWRMEP